jgi:peroxiredoxin Q/BCP
MTRRAIARAALIVIAAGISGSRPVAARDLTVGDLAPPFTLKGSDGETYSLDQFRGERALVIAWFPKAFTGG